MMSFVRFLFGCTHAELLREFGQDGHLYLSCPNCGYRVRALKDDPEHERFRQDAKARQDAPVIAVTRHRKPRQKAKASRPVLVRKRGA